ncbi:hypothetical protein G6F42_012668 [Rhizopus arrhizus]|nr:hypothetical protein G6F42_012668 [Rhizopus arrhizus]
MLQQYYNKSDYMLVQDQKNIMPLDDSDNVSMATTMISDTYPGNKTTSLYGRSSSLCRRISTSIRKNLHDTLQSRRERKREKRPQDGKTNPME